MEWNKPGNVYDFDNMATYAHGVGPASQYIMYWPANTQVPIIPNEESLFVQEMHKRDLQVHPWTLRDDDLQYTSNTADEHQLYYSKGVDGIFTEFVSTTFGIFSQITNQ
jgi:glycerophosphoryl diester phosphodiesterase